jgi:ribosome-binding protein aMBF1 (putative translation factor)
LNLFIPDSDGLNLLWDIQRGDQKFVVSRIPVKKSLYSAEYERFLQLLREAREAAGLTQLQAARKMGRLQSFVSKCESGERRVDIIELGKFSQAYGVRLAQFLKKLDPRL